MPCSTAAQADRLWIPTWLYPDDVLFPYHYWPCPRSMALELRSAYRATFRDARKLTTQLDELAIHTSGPSRALTAHRRNPAPLANIDDHHQDKNLGLLSPAEQHGDQCPPRPAGSVNLTV